MKFVNEGRHVIDNKILYRPERKSRRTSQRRRASSRNCRPVNTLHGELNEQVLEAANIISVDITTVQNQ